MKRWSRLHTFFAGAGLVLLVNAVALTGVAYNRGGEPEAQLRLSEREVQLPYPRYAHAEDSGVALWLRWRVAGDGRYARWQSGIDFGAQFPGTPWLDAAKMAALGFDVPAPGERAQQHSRYARQLQRDALLVLELAGPAWQAQRALAREASARADRLEADNPGDTRLVEDAKTARLAADEEDNDNSRLFVVDAGTSLAALRTRYPDRTRYAIVKGLVGPAYYEEKGVAYLRGNVHGLFADRVHVPLEFRDGSGAVPLSITDNADATRASRLTADIAFGRRLEPWLVTFANSR